MKGLPKNTIAWLLFCGSLAGAGQPGGSPRSRGRGVYETAAVYPGTVKLPAAP